MDLVKRLLVVPAIALLAACSYPTAQPGPTTVTKTVHIQDPGQSSFTKGWRTGVRYACNRLYGGPVASGQWRYEYRMCIRMAKYGPPTCGGQKLRSPLRPAASAKLAASQNGVNRLA